jgi:hypothetical protein
VTVRAIFGLVVLNFFMLGVGTALMFAFRGWRSWYEALRLAGCAYFLGVAGLGVALVLELVVGLTFSLPTILGTGATLAGAAVLVGRRREPGAASPCSRGQSLLVAALFGAATLVYMEALFRSGRLRGLYEFDAWAFWVPKAKAIYYYGGLDRQFFHDLPGPSYPPLLPALQAESFHFMGSADVVTLHVQFWFLLAGFIAAAIGILAPRVRAWIMWPPLILLLVAPYVVDRALQPQADFLLDEFVALAGLLLALWVLEQQVWLVAAAGLFLAAAMLTKREGYVLAGCLVAAALVASVGRGWRCQAPVVLAAGVAVLLTVPWRLFLTARHLTGGGPEAGGTGLVAHLDRAWPSLKLALSALFGFGDWLMAMPLALAAVLLAAMDGSRRLAVFGATVYVAMVAAFTWTTWAFPSLPITKEASVNPIVRFTGSAIFLTAVLTPLLLATVWKRGWELRRR